MRHRKAKGKLNRTASHRKALLSNLVCSLIRREGVTTTLPKARAASRLADRMVTLAKDGSLHARRQALARLRDESAVTRLFGEIAPRFGSRAGGYTRILHAGVRRGDASPVGLLEWTERSYEEPKKKKKSGAETEERKRPRGKK